jgi:hypothetical protein
MGRNLVDWQITETGPGRLTIRRDRFTYFVAVLRTRDGTATLVEDGICGQDADAIVPKSVQRAILKRLGAARFVSKNAW